MPGSTPSAARRLRRCSVPRAARSSPRCWPPPRAQGSRWCRRAVRSALSLGRPLARYDVALDTTGLDRIVAYEPDDLTLTVEAGVTLERLQSVLAEQGQYLPVDTPPDDRVTVGGLLATARPGAWRGHVPNARDLVLGVAVAQADGALAKSGGRVVKNVSGYDLHRLHTGALGAYGVIVEASFKLAPLPASTCTVAVRCAQLAQAEALAFDLWDRALATRALALLAPAAAALAGLPREPHLLVEFAGGEGTVQRSTVALHDAAVLAHAPGAEDTDPGSWAALRMRAGGGVDGSAVALRLGAPASALRELVEAADAAGFLAWAHPAASSVLACGLDDAEAVAALRALAVEVGGFLQIEAGPAALRSAIDPFALAERELVRALKQQFDPTGTLNPGRWAEDV